MKITTLLPPQLIPILLVLTISACAKVATPKCEKWEIVDEKFNIGGCIDWSCAGRRNMQLNFCGAALNDAIAGNTITLSVDPCCKKTRTFIKLIH